MTPDQQTAWLVRGVGYLHIAGGIISAVLAGTMGTMPGRTLPYPARIRYTQGAIALAFLAAGYCWLEHPDFVPLFTALLIALIITQTGLTLFLTLSIPATPKQQFAYWRRTVPFLVLIVAVGSFEVGISWRIRSLGFETRIVNNQQQTLTNQRQGLRNQQKTLRNQATMATKQDSGNRTSERVENKLDTLLKNQKQNQ